MLRIILYPHSWWDPQRFSRKPSRNAWSRQCGLAHFQGLHGATRGTKRWAKKPTLEYVMPKSSCLLVFLWYVNRIWNILMEYEMRNMEYMETKLMIYHSILYNDFAMGT